MRFDAMIARVMSKVFLAGGFIAGIYGLTEPNPEAVRWALASIVVGVLAAVYGLVRRLIRSQS